MARSAGERWARIRALAAPQDLLRRPYDDACAVEGYGELGFRDWGLQRASRFLDYEGRRWSASRLWVQGASLSLILRIKAFFGALRGERRHHAVGPAASDSTTQWASAASGSTTQWAPRRAQPRAAVGVWGGKPQPSGPAPAKVPSTI
ncbi:hypothetical protein R3P38DRAFT_2769796 [Favolaschia claudopus]|uniref:Uncharacterized protein n=1 Tax=Favolaschia claudopus TaxID=2862362 RepID=A0AAW0CMB8_9AGAR